MPLHLNLPASTMHSLIGVVCPIITDDPGPTLRAMSQRLGIPCISVEYRLSPEYPYPAGLEDCIAVTQHVIDHHMQLGINPRKVIIAGDSAGGE